MHESPQRLAACCSDQPRAKLSFTCTADLSSGENKGEEHHGRESPLQLDPVWDELFPAEQARIVQLLVERVDVPTHDIEVRLRPNGLAGLVREVAGGRRAAA